MATTAIGWSSRVANRPTRQVPPLKEDCRTDCRVQRIPWWAAVLIMLFSYILWFYGLAGFVVQ